MAGPGPFLSRFALRHGAMARTPSAPFFPSPSFLDRFVSPTDSTPPTPRGPLTPPLVLALSLALAVLSLHGPGQTIRDIWNRETWVKTTRHLWTDSELQQHQAARAGRDHLVTAAADPDADPAAAAPHSPRDAGGEPGPAARAWPEGGVRRRQGGGGSSGGGSSGGEGGRHSWMGRSGGPDSAGRSAPGRRAARAGIRGGGAGRGGARGRAACGCWPAGRAGWGCRLAGAPCPGAGARVGVWGGGPWPDPGERQREGGWRGR
jgi:hypothetical protein